MPNQHHRLWRWEVLLAITADWYSNQEGPLRRCDVVAKDSRDAMAMAIRITAEKEGPRDVKDIVLIERKQQVYV